MRHFGLDRRVHTILRAGFGLLAFLYGCAPGGDCDDWDQAAPLERAATSTETPAPDATPTPEPYEGGCG